MRPSLDVSPTPAGAQNGATLQLNTIHTLLSQHDWLVGLVVEAPGIIGNGWVQGRK